MSETGQGRQVNTVNWKWWIKNIIVSCRVPQFFFRYYMLASSAQGWW